MKKQVFRVLMILSVFATPAVLMFAQSARGQDIEKKKEIVLHAQSSATVLRGETGSSIRWASGWLDLATPTDFKKGERLRLTLGGLGKKVVVRLLAKGSDPDSMDGVIPTIVTVPDNRVIEVVIPANSPQIVQISVHAGKSPWNQFPLGSGNGPATLIRAERLKPAT